MWSRLARPLSIVAILLGGGVSVGGAVTAVALKVTTDPSFCNSCHIMEPYVESWKTSSHNFVTCVDCHYEPGILETVEGKFKALSQLAKYVTRTQGTKPWAEVSDYSCMRSGCHSERLLEGEIQFGRIKFDHRDHLFGLRRGMKLRCTSCHSQIVQGEHLTVTTTSCVLCHMKPSPRSATISECDRCHGPPPDTKDLAGHGFDHSDYLARGVACSSCHGDVTRGTGEVPKQRCGTCHNKQEHIERYDDVDYLHRHHVTEHSVSCKECHMEMEHGLPPREQHFKGDCKDCHLGTHGPAADMVKGTGGKGIPDDPGIMYLARVTCRGCHRPPFADAPAPANAVTFRFDPFSCAECHGAGFEDMAQRWQAEFRDSAKQVKAAVDELKKRIDSGAGKDPLTARHHYDQAAWNAGLALLDGSDGAHNLPYARSLLAKAAEDAALGMKALDPAATPPEIRVGPKVASKQNCTTLCHVGIEDRKVPEALGYGFAHEPHLVKAGLDCSACHAEKPHGTVTVKPKDCASCHHPKSEDTKQCVACHTDVAFVRDHPVEGVTSVPMQDLDCVVCHTGIQQGHKRDDVKAACIDCHKEDPVDAQARKDSEHLDEWIEAYEKALADLEARAATAPEPVAAEVKQDLARLRRGGPWHNVLFAKAELARLAARLR